jgi:transcriptional regulator with XRE-family HTH domain
MNTSTFGERLALALRESDIRPIDLARAIGISKSAVSQLVNGTSKGMHPENLVRAARHLRVRVEWLAAGEEPMRGEALSPEDRLLLHAYHQLPTSKQTLVASMVRELAGDYHP